MTDKRWSGVDEIPGVGSVTWTVRITTDGGKPVQAFDTAYLAGGEITPAQIEEVKAYLRV